MEKLIFDSGILELAINDNGVLRFNASDPNVYQRFFGLMDELTKIEEQYKDEIEGEDDLTRAGVTLGRMREMDMDVKTRLSSVFGPENDFDALLGGVNIMAFGGNGERVITNLMQALLPYMQSGLERHRKDAATEAVAAATSNRAQRRSGK